jgi:hypothetical protein
MYFIERGYYLDVSKNTSKYSNYFNSLFNFILINFILICTLFILFLEIDMLSFKFQYYSNEVYFKILILISSLMLTPLVAFIEQRLNFRFYYLHFLFSIYMSFMSVYINDFTFFYVFSECYAFNFLIFAFRSRVLSTKVLILYALFSFILSFIIICCMLTFYSFFGTLDFLLLSTLLVNCQNINFIFILFLLFLCLFLKFGILQVYFGVNDNTGILCVSFSIVSNLVLLCALIKFEFFFYFFFENYKNSLLLFWFFLFFLTPFFLKFKVTLKGCLAFFYIFVSWVGLCLLFFCYFQETTLNSTSYFFFVFIYIALLILLFFELIILYEKDYYNTKNTTQFYLLFLIFILSLQVGLLFLIFRQIINYI